MEPEELRRRFAPKVLNKRIRGQQLFPASDLRSFNYGTFEEVWDSMKFQFVHSFGGFSGAPLQTPREGFAWIKSIGPHPYFWEVRKRDLDGNYSEFA